MSNATPTPAITEDELREEWYGLYARLRAIDPELADQVETNMGMRAAADMRPLLAGFRTIREALRAGAGYEAAGKVAETVAQELLEQYDPS